MSRPRRLFWAVILSEAKGSHPRNECRSGGLVHAVDCARVLPRRPQLPHQMSLVSRTTAGILVLLASTLGAQRSDTTGVITGRVRDSATAEPRAGAAVIVVGSTRGAIAGTDGRYTITGVTPGTATLRVRLFGYK